MPWTMQAFCHIVGMSEVLIQDSGKTSVPKLSTRHCRTGRSLRQLSVEILLMAGLQALCYVPREIEVGVYQSPFPQSLTGGFSVSEDDAVAPSLV